MTVPVSVWTSALNAILALFRFLETRGANRDALQRKLDEKAASGEDFTDAEVRAMVDENDAAFNQTEALINAPDDT